MTVKQITYLLQICALLFVTVLGCTPEKTASLDTTALSVTDPDHWTHRVRSAGHGLSKEAIPGIIEKVQQTHVFGIETDNDIPGRYDSWLDPSEKLEVIREMAAEAHRIGNYAFVYIAGLECITANSDTAKHTFFKDHPDWVQADRDGNRAVFSEKDAFWIAPGDEDVWISPFAPQWRKQWMKHVRDIAATGIDGLWLDIPYWMTHFDGWTETWASFDEYTVAEFKKRTGLNAHTDIDLGNYDDPGFLKWVDFRLDAITEFVDEARQNIQSVNPECLLIPEIYPGLGSDAVIVGADVYRLYAVSDAIAHEYSEGGYTAASREPIDWFAYMTGMFTFRAFAQGKASWMLSYSWDEEEEIEPSHAMENLFLSQIMSGANPYDARGHVMSGSNNYETRSQVYQWLSEHEDLFFSPRETLNPVGLYFSPKTRDYFADNFVPAYKGFMYMLLQAHIEFEIVTPRTLASFDGEVLILPDTRIIDDEELAQITELSENGCALMISGQTGAYGTHRQLLEVNTLAELSGKVLDLEHLGLNYFELAHEHFNRGAYADSWSDNPCLGPLNEFRRLVQAEMSAANVKVSARPGIASQVALVNDKKQVYLANYTGLQANQSANQIPQTDIEVTFKNIDTTAKLYYLPYLGERTMLESVKSESGLTAKLPAISRGAVVWLENHKR